MRALKKRRYSCPNGCDLPRRKKVLTKVNENKWTYSYQDFAYCPNCRSMMPNSMETIQRFFDLYQLHPKLNNAKRLIYKSEYVSAAREAFVVVETALKKKSGLDSHGFDLATKALKFEVDKTGKVIKQPLIAINKLETESEQNEQEGMRYMLMGFFHGLRNIYQHNTVGSGVSNIYTIIIDASFFLSVIDGHSVMKKGHWISNTVDYKKIYKKIPSRIDRIRFIYELRKNQRYQKRKHR